ncbi:MAG: TetR family transcriptional regulator [bacterium]|nr:TetR family transcriptional regulator [bacterium]
MILDKQAAAALTRGRLIDAALSILEGGVQHLTLDAVAKKAAVSKGGLLHHFPSKEALIEAVIRHLLGLFNACVQQQYDSDPDPNPRGRWLRAYARASFTDFDIPMQALATLVPFVHEHPPLNDAITQDAAVWSERLENDGVSPVRAAIIRMACDEYWTEHAIFGESRYPAEALLTDVLTLIAQGANGDDH